MAFGDAGGTTNTVTFTNTMPVGSLALTKEVTGPGATAYGHGPFEVHLTCTDTADRTVWDDTLTLGGNHPLTHTVDNLPADATCTATETRNGGANHTTINGPATITPGQTATLTIDNAFTTGAVKVTKKLAGNAAGAHRDAIFTVRLVTGSRVRDTGGRLVAPAQHLSVPLLSAVVTDGVINPPTLTDAFLLRDYGRPDAPGTGQTVVALHSVHDGRGPGNAFFDMDAPDDADAILIHRGDPLLVDGVRFVVHRTVVRSRTAATHDPTIWGRWRSRGDRLVVITCLQRPGEAASASDNLVILAQRAGKSLRAH